MGQVQGVLACDPTEWKKYLLKSWKIFLHSSEGSSEAEPGAIIIWISTGSKDHSGF